MTAASATYELSYHCCLASQVRTSQSIFGTLSPRLTPGKLCTGSNIPQSTYRDVSEGVQIGIYCWHPWSCIGDYIPQRTGSDVIQFLGHKLEDSSVRLGGRTGRATGYSQSFFEFMDGRWEMEVGPGPGEFRSLLLYFRNFKLMTSSRLWFMIISYYICVLIRNKV